MSKKKKKDKRDDFLSLLSQGILNVLDVGCGNGGLGSKLKERGIGVIGIERNKSLCSQAAKNLDNVFLADIESFKLPLSKKSFDCIMYADILEHLIEPKNILENYKEYLKDDGCIIASIPNIRYYKVILRLLLGGSWDYMEHGILDKSHLRFFTLINIKELFVAAGYQIVEVKRNIVASSGFKLLNFCLFGGLKEFLTYQYYIKAKKTDGRVAPGKKRKKYQF
ncbi:MAG: class I SAM-dependent methyltransferase [Candidatus Omnitrophota bacterium]|nr:class I SAM-dependent methyltransferase [Candidatus Omnitrophota bacterium]